MSVFLDSNVAMVQPKCVEALPSAYRTKVLAYVNIVLDADGLVPHSITQWGKRRHTFGEMIHAAEMVKSYSNEHSVCHDATWIEVRLSSPILHSS